MQISRIFKKSLIAIYLLAATSVGAQNIGGGIYGGSSGGLTVGNAVTGGGANRILYEDGSQNLATSSTFTYNGTTLAAPSVTLSGLTAGGIPIIGTAGLLSYDANLTWDSTNKIVTAGNPGTTTGRFYATVHGYNSTNVDIWSAAGVDRYANGINVYSLTSTLMAIKTPATITATAGTGLAIAAGTAASNAPRALSISQGWTAATSSNISIVSNTTIGAGATGKLLSLQAGAGGVTEVASVSETGTLTIVGAGVVNVTNLGSVSLPSIAVGTIANGSGLYARTGTTLDIAAHSTHMVEFFDTFGAVFNSAVGIGWSATSAPGITPDTNFSRASAGVVQLGTTAANALGSLNLANLTASGTLDTTGTVRLSHGYTVATLPAAGTAGRTAYVTDQLAACVAAGAALTGGGVIVCPTFDNGVAWVGL